MAAFAPALTARDELPLSPGDVVAGKYRVDELIGRGGMAAVFAVTHLGLARQFAIKVILGSSRGGDAFARFEREARATAAIRSAHVVQVFDIGQTETGTPYMVMERLQGMPLSDVLAERSLQVDEIVAITREICDVLGEAHALGIVHRDLKPENVFLADRPNGLVTTKLLDFGISMVNNSVVAGHLTGLTHTNMFLGTPGFTAPEQFEGAALATDKSDVWSLGLLMFRMITGSSPYVGDTFLEVAKAVVEGPVPSLSEQEVRTAPELAAAMTRCLRKNPADRCSIRDVHAWLEGVRGRMPPSAPRSLEASGSSSAELDDRRPALEKPITLARETRAGGPPPMAELTMSPPALPAAATQSSTRAWLVGATVLVLLAVVFLVRTLPAPAQTSTTSNGASSPASGPTADADAVPLAIGPVVIPPTSAAATPLSLSASSSHRARRPPVPAKQRPTADRPARPTTSSAALTNER